MTWTTRPRSKLGDLSAIISGEGPPVLMIHGVGLRSEAWNQQFDALCAEFTVVAVDMPGHGDSGLPDGGMTLTKYSDAIAAILNEPTLIIGHSMGALIALDIAVRYSDHVQGVAALNAIYQRSDEASEAVAVRAASLDGKSTKDPSATLDRWFGTATSPERQACQDWLCAVEPKGYKVAYGVFAQSNGPRGIDLATLSCRALYLTGSKEPNSTPEMSHNMAAVTPQGRAHVIEGAAHMMPMTHARQVNEILVGFARESFA